MLFPSSFIHAPGFCSATLFSRSVLALDIDSPHNIFSKRFRFPDAGGHGPSGALRHPGKPRITMSRWALVVRDSRGDIGVWGKTPAGEPIGFPDQF